jgi:hypothetical protein
MSLQDDLMDVEAALKGTANAESFSRIYKAIIELEEENERLERLERTVKAFGEAMCGKGT